MDEITKLSKRISSLDQERQVAIKRNSSSIKDIEKDMRRLCEKLLTELLFSKKNRLLNKEAGFFFIF